MHLIIKKYNINQYEKWNNFIDKSNNGTLFHKLAFLSYHNQKFISNEHHLAWYKGETLFACMPLGFFEIEDKKIAKSPYGASWGGLVHGSKFKLKDAIEIVDSLIIYLSQNNVNEFITTITPQCYFENYTNYFEFALLQSSFKLTNSDVMHIVKLPENIKDVTLCLDSKCRNQTKKSFEKIVIKRNVEATEFYDILMQDKIRHNSLPTHTLDDMILLKNILPNSIFFDVGIFEDNSRAGVCYFVGNKNCISTFYLAQEDLAKGKNGLNALILCGMEEAVKAGYKYFDFGCSSVNSQIQNIGVSEFKESFGATGLFRNTYKIILNQ
jgi:hypothetical protein